jgi:predicted permease
MPEGLHQFLLRLTSLFRKRALDREMAEELEFHHAMLRDKMLDAGVPQAEADASARRAFHAARWHRTLENLVRDISFSTRLLRKSPGFTVVAILTLALGVGANTTIFSLINGLLLRPLPVPHSDELVVLRINNIRRPVYSFPLPYFRSIELRPAEFSEVIAFDGGPRTVQVKTGSGNEEVSSVMVSGQYFQALQTAPLMGRYLTPEDDRKGGSSTGFAVVISENFWKRWFNSAPDVVGRKLTIANAVFSVVGVMPKSFIGADVTRNPDIYASLSAEPTLNAPENLTEAGYHAWWLTVMARRKPGVSLEQASAALSAETGAIIHDGADGESIGRAEKSHFVFAAESGARGFTYMRMMFTKPLEAVFAMCGGILLLACLNLASLLMARSAARERELATRLALGAARRRLVQQLLIESLMISVLGTLAGLVVAPALSHLLAAMLLGERRGLVQLDTSLDYRLGGFAVLVAIVTSLLIGLVPALRATSGNLSDQIKDGQHATRVHERRAIFPRVLMAFEVGLALILVAGAGLLATSLVRLYRSGAGFDPHGVVNIAFNMDKQSLDGAALLQVYRQIGEGLRHQPGVTDVSFAHIVPLTHTVWDQTHSVAGGTGHDLDMNAVGTDYFRTMRIPLLEGREFTWNDTTPSGLKIVINQAAAKLFFPNQSPLGQMLYREGKKEPFEVVAVVGDAKYEDMRSEAPATGYVPITQVDRQKPSYNAVLRVNGPIAPIAAAARSLAANISPDIPAPVMTTMDSVVDDSMSAERVMALLSVYFAICALVVTGIGLYGTLAYATARRTSEIGIRMALGAKRVQVVSLVFRENAVVALVGSALGLGAAVAASKALESFLYGTSARDPWVLGASVLALATIACAASLLPAIRAARIDPMTAIRCE